MSTFNHIKKHKILRKQANSMHDLNKKYSKKLLKDNSEELNKLRPQ